MGRKSKYKQNNKYDFHCVCRLRRVPAAKAALRDTLSSLDNTASSPSAKEITNCEKTGKDPHTHISLATESLLPNELVPYKEQDAYAIVIAGPVYD